MATISAHYLQSMIYPLTQLYILRSPIQITRVVEWIDQTWTFEVSFLQSPNSTDQKTYFPLSCHIYDLTSSRSNVHRNSNVQRLTEYKTDRISSGDPVTYSLDLMNWKHTFNKRNLAQLYTHIHRKADTCPMHNMYEIILCIIYHENLLHLFPIIRNPCDECTPIATSVLNQTVDSIATDLIRYHPYGNN